MGARAAEAPLPRLSQALLGALPAGVDAPGYDRARLRPGIVHIGLGNFHRAHQAAALDRLFALGRDHDWAVVGGGLMPQDAAQRARLAPQDWLYTLVEREAGEERARVIGAMVGFCPAEPEALAARLAEPDIRLVTLTITEGGYFTAADGGFDADHPLMRADAAAPDAPRSVFGVLLKALRLRRAHGLAPWTVLSCDNLEENGRATARALAGLAAMQSDALAAVVEAEVACPSSMVDRITPALDAAEQAALCRRLGYEDASPVVCEPYWQWVLEDRFPAGRPALEEVGAVFTDDVRPWEAVKLRILNAGHAAIAYAGALLGHGYAHEAMADPDIAAWLEALMTREVIPLLDPPAGLDPRDYLATCARRFANPAVRDTLARLCQDGSDRQPRFVLPSIADALARGAPLEGLALELALWCRYAAEAEPLVDPRAQALRAAARASREAPEAFLDLAEVFGVLGTDPRLRAAFARWIGRLWREDVRAVLRRFVAGGAG
ncbi:MAG: mannitol dehydrogenase family protein [Alphaproteobacteria bacterium]|nr:MAG: mannitol dehydrogenase family protein [Alphaproteobacteria bacterium]